MLNYGECSLGSDEIKGIVNVIVGKGPEIESAFTNGLTRIPTPILSNLRDNLIVKPLTLIVPRNILTHENQCELYNGVIQYACGKAVCDLDLDENLKIIITVVVPDIPLTKINKRKLFQCYYGATRTAIKRALSNYPSKDKVKSEKYRAIHPLVGFRDIRLENPPYLQIALDIPDINYIENILENLPNSDRLILECGTPLIKRYGLEVIEIIREYFDGFIIADLKTMDTGRIEARLAFEHTANAIVLSGVAPKSTILKGISECDKCGILSFIDTINVDNPLNLYKSLSLKPDGLIIHRGIDEERDKSQHKVITKDDFKDENLILSIAGGVSLNNIDDLKNKYDVIIMGRGITKSREPGRVVRSILNRLGGDIDQYRLYLDEDEDIDTYNNLKL